MSILYRKNSTCSEDYIDENRRMVEAFWIMWPIYFFLVFAICVSPDKLNKSEYFQVSALSFVLGFLPLAFTVKVLITGCKEYFLKWSNSDQDVNTFVAGEAVMKMYRSCCYFAAAGTLISATLIKGFCNNWFFSLNAVLMVIPFYICNLQSLVRITFRQFPNHAIACGNSLLYLAILAIPYKGESLFGIVYVNADKLVDAFKLLPTALTNSLIVAAIMSVIIEALKDNLSGIINREPTNVSQSRRRIRRKLLTHRQYNKNNIVFSGENNVVGLWLLGVIYAFVLILALSIVPNVEEQTFAINIQNLSISLTESSGEQRLSFAAYLALCALIPYVIGMMSHWSISDDRLIQSEYNYLIIQGGKLSSEHIRKSAACWTDYCQVLVELYSNVSGIASEDRDYHQLSNILSKIRKFLVNDTCAKDKLVCDILSAKGDINAKILREYPHKEEATAKSNDAQKAQDLLFADDLLKLMRLNWEYTTVQGLPLKDYTPLDLLELMGKWFFEGQEQAWSIRFSAYNIGAYEGIQLLKMDALIYILQLERQNGCGLFWLGCNCKDKPQACVSMMEDISENSVTKRNLAETQFQAKRMELLLIYPHIILQCFKKRWNCSFNDVLFADDTAAYYEKIFDQNVYAENTSQIDLAVDFVLRQFVEHKLDGSFIQSFARLLMDDFEIALYAEQTDDAGKKELERIKKVNIYLARVRETNEWQGKRIRYHQFEHDNNRDSVDEKGDNKILDVLNADGVPLYSAIVRDDVTGNIEEKWDVFEGVYRIAYALFAPQEGGKSDE